MPKTSLLLVASLGLFGAATGWFSGATPVEPSPTLAAPDDARSADLALAWAGSLPPGPEALELTAGTPSLLPVRIHNRGPAEAPARVHRFTPLGTDDPVRLARLAPGTTTIVDLSFVPAIGMREICLRLEIDRTTAPVPRDPNPDDNLLCRRLRISARPTPERGTP